MIEVQHALKAPKTNFFAERIPDMRPGDRFHFRYSYFTAEPLTELGIYLVVTRRAGSGLSLKLLRTRLQVRPRPGRSDPPLEVHRFDIKFAPRLDDPKRAARR